MPLEARADARRSVPEATGLYLAGVLAPNQLHRSRSLLGGQVVRRQHSTFERCQRNQPAFSFRIEELTLARLL